MLTKVGPLFLLFVVFSFSVVASAQERRPRSRRIRYKQLAKKTKPILFWHLVPKAGASADLTRRIERIIRKHFERDYKQDLMGALAMDALLTVEGNEKFLRCGIGIACLSELGVSAGATFVIAGEVFQKKEIISVRLSRISVKTQELQTQSVIRFRNSPTKRLLAELATAMFRPERYFGQLALTCSVPQARVFLDDKPVGSTPLSAFEFPAGFHDLRVEKEGHQPFAKRIHIPFGGTTAVEVTLPSLLVHPSRATRFAFIRKWPFWTASAFSLLALATSIVLHQDAITLQENADLLQKKGAAGYQAKQDQADERYLMTWIGYGMGAASAVGALLIAIIDSTRAPDHLTTPTSRKNDLVLRPQWNPNHVGLTLMFRF